MRIQHPLRFTTIAFIIIGCVLFISAQSNPLPVQIEPAELTSAQGWSCEDFPCEDDIEGFLQRIQVPDGFSLSYMGQFPGQPMQITYGDDGRLYATILEKGTRRGSVYAMDAEGTSERISPRFWSPVGIAFDGAGELYVSGRLNPDSVGAIWRVKSDLEAELIVSELPCCYALDNQPNGMVFGTDGKLYLGVGSTSDHGESEAETYATPQPYEAAVLKIDLQAGTIETYASGIRNPYDLDFTSDGQLYVTDNGLVSGQGDRILQAHEGQFYGFPYWRSRGCPECPPREARDVPDDWLLLDPYTLPRGLLVYDGGQFPANMVDTLFVAFWNGTDYAQRIVWIDPDDPQLTDDDYVPMPFVTGLIRPVDVTIAPDGSLVVADFIYGHIWRVTYGEGVPVNLPTTNATTATDMPEDEATTETLPPVIATVVNGSNGATQPIPATPTPGGSGVVFATSTPSS